MRTLDLILLIHGQVMFAAAMYWKHKACTQHAEHR